MLPLVTGSQNNLSAEVATKTPLSVRKQVCAGCWGNRYTSPDFQNRERMYPEGAGKCFLPLGAPPSPTPPGLSSVSSPRSSPSGCHRELADSSPRRLREGCGGAGPPERRLQGCLRAALSAAPGTRDAPAGAGLRHPPPRWGLHHPRSGVRRRLRSQPPFPAPLG